MIKKLGILISVLMFFLFLGDIQAQKIKTVDGVEIISNGRKPRPPKGFASKVVLTEEATIGLGDDPDQSLSEAALFVIDDKGRFIVLDQSDRQIKSFDRTGKFLRMIGKEGQGPGEIGMASGIQLTPDNKIMVEDASNRRLAFFTSEGEFIENIPFGTKLSLVNLYLDDEGNYLGREMVVEETQPSFVVKKYDKDLNPLFTLDKIAFNISVSGTSVKMNPFELLAVYQLDEEGYIYYGRNLEYEIKVYDPEGKHVRTIQKDHKAVKVTEEDKEKMLDRIPNVSGVNVRDMMVFPESYPPFQSFILDERGHLYVRTFDKGKEEDEFAVDLFDVDGLYYARFFSKIDIRIWEGSTVYGIEENEEGYRIIKRYRAAWE